MTDESKYEAALRFAKLKHSGQFRKNGEPYVTHPIAVAEMLKEKGHKFEDVSDIEEFRIFDIDILQYNNDETNSEKVLDAYYMGKTTSAADAVAYEVKTDTYGIVSRNIVFEDLSNSNSGCMARTKADYLFYVFVL